MPEGFADSVRQLARIAAGHDPSTGYGETTIGVDHRTTTEGELMDIFEVEQKERLGREECAARPRKLADMLARGNELEFETDERELEIELKW